MLDLEALTEDDIHGYAVVLRNLFGKRTVSLELPVMVQFYHAR